MSTKTMTCSILLALFTSLLGASACGAKADGHVDESPTTSVASDLAPSTPARGATCAST